MKIMWRFVPAVLTLSLFLLPAAARAGTQDFTIPLFSADYSLSRDAGNVPELKVTERIEALFPDTDQNHGILRAIPESYQGHGLEVRVSGVKDRAGKPWAYSTYHENGNVVLKIGDADRYVHGSQLYVIDYTVRGVIMDTKDGQEFYWDVNGDQWQQEFGRVEARLSIPADIAAKLQPPSRCYTGKFGAQASDCNIYYTYDQGKGRVITAATKTNYNLYAGETLSIEFGFAKGTFAAYTPSARQIQEWALQGLAVSALPLVTLFVLIRNYLRTGRDPKGKGVVVPQYLPPKDVSVLGASDVWHEGFRPKAASATIIDLAVRHYLKIYETKQGLLKKADYEIELVKASDDLRPEETRLLTMLFGTPLAVGDRVKLSERKTTMATKVVELAKDAEQRISDAGYFAKMPSKAKAPYFITGSVLLGGGFIVVGGGMWVTLVAISAIVAGAILLVGAAAMPARTSKGVDLREYLKGLQDYMKLAEADRLKVLQSPRGELTEKIDVGDNKQLIKLYERLLPYAVLFGIEKDWAKVMAPLYEQPPDWYSGTTAFNAGYFAGSLGSFAASSGAAFSPPSSSGSGGGAGGGGGGGGGGGW